MTIRFEDLLTPYNKRKLDLDAGYKPLDFGLGGLTGSITQDGRLVALNAYHEKYGYITLTGMPPFDERSRYHPAQVRRYRRAFVGDDGFGLAFDASIMERAAYLVEDAIPYIRLQLENGVLAECLTFPSPDAANTLVQWWQFSEMGEFAHFTGKVWLQRCAYTQLTEGGPITMPAPDTRLINQGITRLHNPALDASVYTGDVGDWINGEDGSIVFLRTGTAYPQRTGSDQFVLTFSFDAQSAANPAPLHGSSALIGLLNHWIERWEEPTIPDSLLLRRALVYADYCCVPLPSDAAEDETPVCILTDHMLLPLSWNRDAYYVARGLLNWREEMHSRVRGHLLWMFERAERINGAWGRSYLANGQAKDHGFQLDQQLFPLLELAEYVLESKATDLPGRFTESIVAAMQAIMRHKMADAWLFATEETPADDPITYPYHLSSHILMWRTFSLLARLDFKLAAFDFMVLAKQVQAAIDTYFIAENFGKRMYAYATDGAGQYHFYHDANDIPLVMAPSWGMLSADDPVWWSTIEFAFSPANTAGFYEGCLGSVHTRAPWPLGDVQEVIIARARGDVTRMQAARKRLAAAGQWDGALPEAYNGVDYSVVSRHWFCWPNAMLTNLDLPDKMNITQPIRIQRKKDDDNA